MVRGQARVTIEFNYNIDTGDYECEKPNHVVDDLLHATLVDYDWYRDGKVSAEELLEWVADDSSINVTITPLPNSITSEDTHG